MYLVVCLPTDNEFHVWALTQIVDSNVIEKSNFFIVDSFIEYIDKIADIFQKNMLQIHNDLHSLLLKLT